jgi:hypothetical protein
MHWVGYFKVRENTPKTVVGTSGYKEQHKYVHVVPAYWTA